MRTDETLYTVVREQDYDFKAWRVLDGKRNQVCAVLFNFRSKGWVLKLLWHSGSGTMGGKTLAIGWRTDSAKWCRQFRNIRKGFLGLEVSTSCNGPYMSR